MAKTEFDKLLDFFKRHQYFLWGGAIIFIICITLSFNIYDDYKGHDKQGYYFKIADFLVGVAQTILGTILIGGGLGGVFNFIVEEQKKEEEAVKERLKKMQESRDQRKEFRYEIRRRLQGVYDNVELARILIKSHRSGRTYGEQIRELIIPSNIVLQDIKQQLQEVQDESPIHHLSELRVSLTYMSAYLSVIIEEFAQHYLDIANLQNYQDTLAERRRDLFSELLMSREILSEAKNEQQIFINKTNTLLQDRSIPNRMQVVWDAMGHLDYVWDFIGDLRNDKGFASRYQTFFVDHHFHCFRLLRDKGSELNNELCTKQSFQKYLQALETLIAKKKSDEPITKKDSLTRMVMIDQLHFDFEKMGQRENKDKL